MLADRRKAPRPDVSNGAATRYATAGAGVTLGPPESEVRSTLLGWWSDVYAWDEFPGFGGLTFAVAEASPGGPSSEPGR